MVALFGKTPNHQWAIRYAAQLCVPADRTQAALRTARVRPLNFDVRQ
jgi:hypothetical protein